MLCLAVAVLLLPGILAEAPVEHSAHLLQDIGLCIVAATLLAYAARAARQPLLLAYIAAGMLIGPIGLRLVSEQQSIQTLAELGLAFLMFIVGLEIKPAELLATGRNAAIVTGVQVAGCGLLGYLAARGLGYRGLPAAYLGVAVAFSSTMIVVKLLADRAELGTLPGRVTLGILVLQDVAAIVVLAVQPNLGQGLPLGLLVLAAFKGLGLVAAAVLVSRYGLPLLFGWVAKLPEIMLLSAVTWCFVVCYAALQLGFSTAMGALIAGVSISAFPYSLEVVAKIRSLRDFFVTLFFVSLGMLLTKPEPGLIAGAALLAVVVIVSRFLTVWPMLRLLGCDNRVGVLSSIHLSQISEFALVIALIGIAPPFHHINQGIVSLVVLLLIITSTISTYLIQLSHPLVALLVGHAGATVLKDRQSPHAAGQAPQPAPVMLVGCFRIGSSLVHELRQAGRPFSCIDFNPLVQAELTKLGVPCVYGDISHLDTLEHAGVEHAQVLIASIPDDFLRGTDNGKLLAALRKVNPHAKVIVTAESITQALALYDAGADYVLLPRVLAAGHLLEVLARLDADGLDGWRGRHIAGLKARAEVLP